MLSRRLRYVAALLSPAREIQLALLCVLTLGSSATYALQIYTDRAVWEAAIETVGNDRSRVVVDRFDNPIPSARSITFDGGVVSTVNFGGLPPPVVNNEVSGGTFNGVASGDASYFLEISPLTPTGFVPYALAWGTDFINSATNEGLRFFVAVGEEPSFGYNTLDLFGPPGDGFFGVVGVVFFVEITASPAQPFSLDNFTFKTVPEPATLALFSVALVGLAFTRCRGCWRTLRRPRQFGVLSIFVFH